MRRDIKTLLLKNQEDILHLLFEKGFVDDTDLTSFTRAKLTKDGIACISSRICIPDDFLIAFRELFPKGARSTPSEIGEKITIFLNNNPNIPLDWDKFFKAAELYVQDRGAFAGYAKYFFHKTKGAEVEYRILEYLEYVDEAPKKSFGNKIL